MQSFRVEGMTCGHCERTVTGAVQGVDPGARVEVDLVAGLVRTDSNAAAEQIAQAIRAEGYEAQALNKHAL